MGNNNISHCFPLNGNTEAPDITGIDEVVATYRKNKPEIGFGKVVKFAPVLENFRKHVAAYNVD